MTVQASSRSEGRFRLLLDATALAIVGVDGGGRITMANRSACALFGYTESELVGAAIETLVLEPARAGHVADRDRFLRHPVTRPMCSDRRLTALGKDGSEFPAEISLAALDEGDDRLVAATVIRPDRAGGGGHGTGTAAC